MGATDIPATEVRLEAGRYDLSRRSVERRGHGNVNVDLLGDRDPKAAKFWGTVQPELGPINLKRRFEHRAEGIACRIASHPYRNGQSLRDAADRHVAGH